MFQRNLPWRAGLAPLCALLLGFLPLVNCGGSGGAATPDPNRPGIQSLTASDPAVPPGSTVQLRVVPVPGATGIQWNVTPPWVMVTDRTQPRIAVQAPRAANAIGSAQVTISYPNGHRGYGAITLGTLGPAPAPMSLAVFQTEDNLEGVMTYQAVAGDPAAEFGWSPNSGGDLTGSQGGPTMTVTQAAGSAGSAIEAVTATTGDQTASLFLPGATGKIAPDHVDLLTQRGTFQFMPDGSYQLYGPVTGFDFRAWEPDGSMFPRESTNFTLEASNKDVVSIAPDTAEGGWFWITVKQFGVAFDLTVTASAKDKSFGPLTKTYRVKTVQPLLFVADATVKGIRILGRSDHLQKSFIPLGPTPGQIAVDLSGTLAVGLADRTIAVYPDYNNPEASTRIIIPAGQNDPNRSIAIDHNQNIYVTDTTGSMVFKFKPDNGAYTKASVTYSGGTGLTCAVGDGDSLWLQDSANPSTITRFPYDFDPSDPAKPPKSWTLPLQGSRFTYNDIIDGIYDTSSDRKLHIYMRDNTGDGLVEIGDPEYPLPIPAGVSATMPIITDDLGRLYFIAIQLGLSNVYSLPGIGYTTDTIAPWTLPGIISSIAVIPRR